MKKIRVGVAGYGTIGQRLADGVAMQGDMELVGIADLAPTLSIRALAENDAYPTLAAVDGLVITGPTGTNVNDVAIGLLDVSEL